MVEGTTGESTPPTQTPLGCTHIAFSTESTGAARIPLVHAILTLEFLNPETKSLLAIILKEPSNVSILDVMVPQGEISDKEVATKTRSQWLIGHAGLVS